MSNAETYRTYLDLFTSGDKAGAAKLLTDDFRFHGPMLQSEGKDAFFVGSEPLCPIMRGADVHRQWEDGDELCSFYDFKVQTAQGVTAVPMFEWTTFRDGKLAAARVVFDTVAMAPPQT